ncbi:Class I mannose-6-phosphate isomerase [Candidatus Hepatincolaceae symbiont of Richtersius coronifer]
MIMLYPLKFKSIFKERIWGGNLIKNQLKKDTGSLKDNIGESWDICDREADNSIVENGIYQGLSLKDIRLRFKDKLLGTQLDFNQPFPILVKILDAAEDLSLQVHPKYNDLPSLPKGAQPKTEFWYVLDHLPEAKIMAGLNNYKKKNKLIYKEEFIKNISSEKIRDFVQMIPSAKNLLLYIESGTIHAIGAGNLILEIQENSDTTYRVSDWGRVDKNNQPRELHLKESLLCINFNDNRLPEINPIDLKANKQVVKGAHFSSFSNFIESGILKESTAQSCEIISVVDGAIAILYKFPLENADENNPHSFSNIITSLQVAKPKLTLQNFKDEVEHVLILNKGESCLLPANIAVVIFPYLTDSATFLNTLVVA